MPSSSSKIGFGIILSWQQMEKLIETIDDVEKTCDFSCAYNESVTPYKEPKQKELNEVNGNGFRRMMKKVNPQF
ncbi:hypothetical protein GLOIN_2v1782904 [Rhizophagus irregularis DAOM 181602=DAOM 197198]|uniref:Uncharacterized protein n=1 Tax=Rhizophagus irregularis (strain DAOM 181602 / DAOM 197198 / MUCL 43194) TaxID=747089 RepID=A0A2P4PGG9_RHIID|nr:hypothetical protein GLOIN_2v1782904 [Rhizophagus irregularis DAOM 181602=DAOM 197198]POG64488.1 hypothetical protein GLOIN_2v1782904 [Rhizophagus irregularis DAOM 181602=DAOM 197198]|eukprot:XP_025171354.1 hypothetical protein GLOIN_2v1782904 [Rhizophagus irregularis DAOM 181602=DAOM 197198]